MGEVHRSATDAERREESGPLNHNWFERANVNATPRGWKKRWRSRSRSAMLAPMRYGNCSNDH